MPSLNRQTHSFQDRLEASLVFISCPLDNFNSRYSFGSLLVKSGLQFVLMQVGSPVIKKPSKPPKLNVQVLRLVQLCCSFLVLTQNLSVLSNCILLQAKKEVWTDSSGFPGIERT